MLVKIYLKNYSIMLDLLDPLLQVTSCSTRQPFFKQNPFLAALKAFLSFIARTCAKT